MEKWKWVGYNGYGKWSRMKGTRLVFGALFRLNEVVVVKGSEKCEDRLRGEK